MTLFRLLTDVDGRIGLSAFWLGNLLVVLGVLALQQVGAAIGGLEGDRLGAFAGAFALFPWAALAAKRAADRGRPRLYGIVLVSAIVLLDLAETVVAPDRRQMLGAASSLLWLVALVDLGLLPGSRRQEAVAEPPPDAKRAG